MKRFSIRSKTNIPTLSSQRGSASHIEDIEAWKSDSKGRHISQASEQRLLEDDYGLKLLSLGRNGDGPPRSTLIFIHGLGGHFTRTWSHERNPQLCWPKVWLPTVEGLHAVRIMSFGYDAAIFRQHPSLACISDFARTLLMEILVAPGLSDDGVCGLGCALDDL